MHLRRSLAFALATALCLAVGCTAPAGNVRVASSSEGSTAVLRGDWNDLDAAVEIAAEVNEMSVLATSWPIDAPRSRRDYELVTVGDEPVRLAFVPRGQSDPGEIEARARVGRFGDARRERRLLDAVGMRLQELAGVEAAPTRLR